MWQACPTISSIRRAHGLIRRPMRRRRAISPACLKRISPNSPARRRNSVCRRKPSMHDYQEVGGLKVARTLYDFIADEVLPGTGIAADTFWAGFGKLVGEYSPRIRAQLQIRDDLQEKIDTYHLGHRGRPFDPVDYEKFLREIGYL